MEKAVDKQAKLWINMFIGEYTYSIDEKKRLAIPVKFRKALEKRAIITKGLDKCLYLYSIKEWEKMAEKIAKLPLTQADARGFSRLMLGGAMEVSIDSLGRILIPDYLKNYATLKKKVIFVGMYNKVEIWDEMEFEKYKNKTETAVEDIAEHLKELGI